MSGMFAATDQNYYEINIPSPHTYETEEEAMADGAFGYRFVLLPGGKGPQVVIFEGSGFRLVCDGKENYIKDWVEGDIVGIYDFDEFTKPVWIQPMPCKRVWNKGSYRNSSQGEKSKGNR